VRRETLVIVIDLDRLPVRPHPQPPADQAVRRGVVGTVHDYVTVMVELGELPDSPIVGTRREGKKLPLLRGEKAGEGPLFRRSVNPHARRLLDPLQKLLVRRPDRLRGPAGNEIPLHVANT